MKSFYHYLAESAREFRFRIKSVVPMDEKFVETVKRELFKYDLVSVSKPKKTMLQKNPLDFRDYAMSEVWMMDIVTKITASSYVLATELRGALKVTDSVLIVRGENEPREIEARAMEEIHKDQESVSKLQDPDYSTDEQPREVAFGDEYNKKFLNYLSQIRANALDTQVPAIEDVKKISKFNWLNKIDDQVAGDFNADIDTVKPVHVNSKKKGGAAVKPNLAGNFDNYDETVKRKG